MYHSFLRLTVLMLSVAIGFGVARAQETNKPASAVRDLPLGLNPVRVIDVALEQGYIANSLTPAKVADDAAFARRLYLDVVGRVPRTSEMHDFLGRTHSNKREQLIDQLLISEEHAVHFAEVLDAILIGRTNADQVMRRTDAGWMAYLKKAIQDNRPWNQVARELVLARPTSSEVRGASWYLYARKDKHQDIAESVSKDLFGVRIDCAQCHDHPLADEIKQQHYWGLVAFFNRSKNEDTPQGPRIAESAIGGFSEFANLQGSSSPNELRFLEDRYVEEMRPAKDAKEEEKDDLYTAIEGVDPKVPKFSRREQFADKVLAGHPLLGKAMVNRLWAWMMGRGIVHPVDSLDSFHPPSHPELLDWLARDFAHSNYNVRRLIKALATSQVYQYASENTGVSDPKWFATSLTKPLTAEMLQRSMITVLEPQEQERWNGLEQRVAFANLFPDVLAEDSVANVSQGLLLSNSATITELVSVKQSRFLKRVLEVHDLSVSVGMLFEGVLGRAPTDDELKFCLGYLDKKSAEQEKAIEGLAWALITSAEFRFNH